MQSIPEKYRDFNKFLEPLKKMDPELTIHEIKNDVAAFVESSFKTEKPQTLLIIENKAKLLFEPFLERLIEKKFSPAFVRSAHYFVWIKETLSKKFSILADSINTGDEIIKLVNNLAANDYTVDKIYCYVLNAGAIRALRRDKIASNIPIVSAHKVEMHVGDPPGLVEKLKILYTSLPDPMDLDHAYDVYYGNCSLTPSKLKSVIEDCCKRAICIDGASFKHDEKLILPKGIESMRMEISQPRLISVKSDPKIKELAGLLQFDYANFKLKTYSKKHRLRFSLTGCFPINSLRRKYVNPKDGCHVCKASQCYHKLITGKISKVLRWKTLCPLCIQNYIERSILNEVHTFIKDSTKGNGNFTVQPHDPFNRQY